MKKSLSPTLEALLAQAQENPFPAAHTSSHWREFGEKVVIQRQENTLSLTGFGFGQMRANLPGLSGPLSFLERLSYRQVTVGMRHYPATWKAAKILARDLGFDLTFDVWKQAVCLSLLMDHSKESQLEPKVFFLIGDGYGFLGALIRRLIPDAKLYLMDLPKMLVFQCDTLERSDRRLKTGLLSGSGSSGDVVFVHPDQIEQIPSHFDWAVNIASMQEMTSSSIRSYFDFLRARSSPDSRFYCINRREKVLPGGGVIRFSEYPWHPQDAVFLDGPCPYYTHYVSHRLASCGPRLLGLRVPFLNHFDGPMWHRLVSLAPAS